MAPRAATGLLAAVTEPPFEFRSSRPNPGAIGAQRLQIAVRRVAAPEAPPMRRRVRYSRTPTPGISGRFRLRCLGQAVRASEVWSEEVCEIAAHLLK